MAYARYSSDCDWYIFWVSSSKKQEQLAIWHSDHRSTTPTFCYSDVEQMVNTEDFTRIPGFTNADHELLTACVQEFLNDAK